MDNSGGHHLLQFPHTVRGAIADAVASISPKLPLFEFHKHDLNLSSGYREVHVEATMLRSGYIELLWKATRFNYISAWGNPPWDFAEMPVDSEAQQVREKIRSHLDSTFEFGIFSMILKLCAFRCLLPEGLTVCAEVCFCMSTVGWGFS